MQNNQSINEEMLAMLIKTSGSLKQIQSQLRDSGQSLLYAGLSVRIEEIDKLILKAS